MSGVSGRFGAAVVALFVVGGTLGGATAASAHEYWLAPSSYRAAPGESVSVKAFVGTGFKGDVYPYATPRAIAWAVRSSTMQDLRSTSVNGDEVFGRWVEPDKGGALVAYESNFASIELPAADFDAYLALEGLDEPRAARAKLGAQAGPGRERYARCPKSWIAGSDASRVTTPVGQSLEIVPQTDPTLPGALAVRVLFRGQPLEGALVRAWRHALAHGFVPVEAAGRDSTGPVARARTDAKGMATLTLSGGGEWMVSAVHMIPSEDPRHADWQSYWASLTFARAERRK